jgi:membrane associated rhomboid family serine protease
MKVTVTGALIALNIIGFIWEMFVGGSGVAAMFGGDSVNGVYQRGGLIPGLVLQDGQWWRIFSSAFLHEGLLHIGVNMISLWSLGRFIEWTAGPYKMAIIYFISMIASGIGVVFLSAPNSATIGASGAIFGLFGALFAIGLKLGKPGMDMLRANVGILVVNILISLAPGISWQGHFSGAIAGFAVAFVLYYPPRRVAPVVVDAATGAELETEYQAPNPPSSQSPT